MTEGKKLAEKLRESGFIGIWKDRTLQEIRRCMGRGEFNRHLLAWMEEQENINRELLAELKRLEARIEAVNDWCHFLETGENL